MNSDERLTELACQYLSKISTQHNTVMSEARIGRAVNKPNLYYVNAMIKIGEKSALMRCCRLIRGRTIRVGANFETKIRNTHH